MRLWPPRLSLGGALGLSAIAAVGLAALIVASPTWGRLTYTLTLATLAVASLGGLFARGRARVFWAGFAILGWAYFFAPASIRTDLLTTRGINILGTALHPPHLQKDRYSGPERATYDPETRTYYVDVGGRAARAEQIAQHLLTLLLALLGGLVAHRFATRPHRPGLD